MKSSNPLTLSQSHNQFLSPLFPPLFNIDSDDLCIINPRQSTSISLVPLSLHHTCLANSNSRWSWVPPFSDHKPKLTLYNYRKTTQSHFILNSSWPRNVTITLFNFLGTISYFEPSKFLFFNWWLHILFHIPHADPTKTTKLWASLSKFSSFLPHYNKETVPFPIKTQSFHMYLRPHLLIPIQGFWSSVRLLFPILSISHKLLVIM